MGQVTDRPAGAVRRLYDGWAAYYDWNPALALVRPARERAVAAMGLQAGDVAVDMGTGTGANLPHLREAVGPAGRVVGVDLSPGMLRQARGRIERRGWENVHLLRGDVLAPPIEGPIDGIASGFLVVMYEEPEQLLEAWSERLSSEGAIANVYAGPSERWYGAVPNGLLSAYLRTFEPGWVTDQRPVAPLAALAARGDRAREALAERADAFAHRTGAFGLAQIDVGRFDGE